MISFPVYQSLEDVLATVKTNIEDTQPDATQLPVVGYIGFVEPRGTRVVIELDSMGTVNECSSRLAEQWVANNSTTLTQMFTNLVNEHGELPENMTLTLVGYIFKNVFTLVDGQLAVDGKHSAYWLSTTVLNQILKNVAEVPAAFDKAIYVELDFNKPESFVAAAVRLSNGQPTMWQITANTQFAIAPVLRDPYRITL